MMHKRINGKEEVTKEKAIAILDNLDAAFELLNEALYAAGLLKNISNESIREELMETRRDVHCAQLSYENLKYFTKSRFDIEED